eukprot:scaffold12265_cov116-Isochrysis_galbana.AAC.1
MARTISVGSSRSWSGAIVTPPRARGVVFSEEGEKKTNTARAAYSDHARRPVRTQCASASQPVGQVMPCRHPHVTYDCGHVWQHETTHAHIPGMWRAAVAQAEKDGRVPLAAGDSARSSTPKRAGLPVQARRARSRGPRKEERSKCAREVGASDASQ